MLFMLKIQRRDTAILLLLLLLLLLHLLWQAAAPHNRLSAYGPAPASTPCSMQPASRRSCLHKGELHKSTFSSAMMVCCLLAWRLNRQDRCILQTTLKLAVEVLSCQQLDSPMNIVVVIAHGF
jgi:hypothetical protein